MKILLTRHGQTTGNLEGRITGHIDVSLTALGKAQAKLLCDYIQENYMVDAIYTSMLSRAQNTIKPLAQSLNVSPILDKRINELNAGEWEGILVSDLKQNCPQDLIRWSKEPRTFFCPNGESFENVYDRVLEFLLEVVKTDAKTVCVCAHGGVIRYRKCRGRDCSAQKKFLKIKQKVNLNGTKIYIRKF